MTERVLLVSSSGPETRARIRDVVLAEGWRPGAPPADGALGFERGSLGRTVLLGVLAGKNFHLSLRITLEGSPEGTRIRYRPGPSEGGVLGGILGARLAQRQHESTLAALRTEFAGAGLLVGEEPGH